MRGILNNLVTAWEALPGDQRHSPRAVEQWLAEHMKPAVDLIREALVGVATEKDVNLYTDDRLHELRSLQARGDRRTVFEEERRKELATELAPHFLQLMYDLECNVEAAFRAMCANPVSAVRKLGIEVESHHQAHHELEEGLVARVKELTELAVQSLDYEWLHLQDRHLEAQKRSIRHLGDEIIKMLQEGA